MLGELYSACEDESEVDEVVGRPMAPSEEMYEKYQIVCARLTLDEALKSYKTGNSICLCPGSHTTSLHIETTIELIGLQG
jgi:hypothetical protein